MAMSDPLSKRSSGQEKQADYYKSCPFLSQDKIFFITDGSVWFGDLKEEKEHFTTEKPVVKLTENRGCVVSAAISPSGKTLAFLSTQEGHSDIYLTSLLSGQPKRMTYVEGIKSIVCFKDEITLIVVCNAAAPFRAQDSLVQLNLASGILTPMALGDANFISYFPGQDKNKQFLLGRYGYGYTSWKGYQGGAAAQIWSINKASEEKLFQHLKSNLLMPVVLQDRIFFVSDHDDRGAVYSSSFSGQDIQKCVQDQDFYVRSIHTDGRRLVYQVGGNIGLFDPKTSTAKPIIPKIISQRLGLARSFESPRSCFSYHAVSPNGSQVCLITRGRVFVGFTEDGPMVQVGCPHGVRYRLASWLSEEELVLVKDVGQEECVEVVHVGSCAIRSLTGAWGRIVDLKILPAQNSVVFSNHAHSLMQVDLKHGKTQMIEEKSSGPYNGFSADPSGRYVAYSKAISSELNQIFIWDGQEKKRHALSRPVLGDAWPVFDEKGLYLAFLSRRTACEESESSVLRLYVLSSETPCPFFKGQAKESLAHKKNEKKSKKPAGAKTVIDFQGLENRQFSFPLEDDVVSGDLSHLSSADQRFFYLRHGDSATGKVSQGHESVCADLCVYDLRTFKEDVWAEDVQDFSLTVDAEGSGWISCVTEEKQLRFFKASEKPDEETSSKKNAFDWDRVSLEVLPQEEWRFMFQEAWRLQKDLFWTPSMGQVDWEEIKKRYEKLLPLVSTKAELMDVISEMQGELRVSHAYTWGYDRRPGPAYPVGFLGAQTEAVKDGAKITCIFKGDVRFQNQRSPLRSCLPALTEGDVIQSVDGRPVTQESPLESLLVNKAGKKIFLGVRQKGKKNSVRVILTPLSNTRPLHYANFVQKNTAYVHQKSKGKLGYIHIPDMSSWGYQEFYRAYAHEFDYPGLVIDVRFNGGGNISTQILSRLMRKRLGFDQARHEGRIPYMFGAPQGPMVAVCNAYTGSDGDMFSYAFQRLKLGPLIGQRTWGGVIGIFPKHPLLDGSWTSQPEYAIWFHDIGWSLENKGVQPDIDVDITPLQGAAGKDPQLDRAIEEGLKEVKKQAA